MSWQERLDELFPYGAMVTQIKDVPEWTADSPTFLTPRFIVDADEEQPQVHFHMLAFDKDVRFVIEKLEEFSPGVWLVHTPTERPDFLLSLNFGTRVRDALEEARKDWERPKGEVVT
jgi:hypothetical protein